MSTNKSVAKSAVDRFWDRYINRIHKQGIKNHQTRWYLIRAEQYIKAFPDKRLAQHTVEEINGYLESLGRPDDAGGIGRRGYPFRSRYGFSGCGPLSCLPAVS